MVSERWWANDPREQYWCEITDRDDLGTDLKCPQTDETGSSYWSYDLVREVRPGEIVFHYSTPKRRAFVGPSVAGGALEERPIVWTPHGTVGRGKRESRGPRPGLRLPLHHFVEAKEPLKLGELNEPENQAWIRAWIEGRGKGAMVPLQLYPGALRGAQGYLVKMPSEWVERWAKLRALAEQLAETQDELTSTPAPQFDAPGGFKRKSEEDYVAMIKASRQVKTRHHERLVRLVGERLRAAGAEVSTPHPIDLLMTEPQRIIFEAKAVGPREPLFAVREAIGQLLVYRHFVLRDEATPACILLDKAPPAPLVDFVENSLGFLIAWLEGNETRCGSASAPLLPGFRATPRAHAGG